MARRPGSRREAPSLKVPPSTSRSSWPSGERATRGVFSSRTSSRLLRATLTVCGKPGRGVTACLTDSYPSRRISISCGTARSWSVWSARPAGWPSTSSSASGGRAATFTSPSRGARRTVSSCRTPARRRDGDRRLVVALLRHPDRVLPARLDRELERRLAAVDPVHLDPRARGLAPDDEHRRRRWRRLSRGRRRQGDESDGETLLLPPPLDRDPGPELLVAVGADPDLALPRLRLERGERRRAHRPAVHRDLGSGDTAGVHGEAARQELHRQRDHLPRLARHLDRRLEPAVAVLLGDERVGAGQRHEARGEPRDRPTAAERHRVGLGIDRHAERGQLRDEDGQRARDQQQSREGDRPAARRPPGPWQRPGAPRRVADRLDGRAGRRVLRRESLVAWRGDEDDGRLGRALLGQGQDDEAHAVRPDAHLDPRRTEAQGVAVPQPVGRGEPGAVAEHRGAGRRLHEDLAVGEAQPGERSPAPRHRHRRAGPAQGHREVRGAQGPRAPSLFDPDRGQRASSQRTTIGAVPAPGATVNLRRTSR